MIVGVSCMGVFGGEAAVAKLTYAEGVGQGCQCWC